MVYWFRLRGSNPAIRKSRINICFSVLILSTLSQKWKGKRQKGLFFYFCFLECRNCWWMKGDGVDKKFLLKAD